MLSQNNDRNTLIASLKTIKGKLSQLETTRHEIARLESAIASQRSKLNENVVAEHDATDTYVAVKNAIDGSIAAKRDRITSIVITVFVLLLIATAFFSVSYLNGHILTEEVQKTLDVAGDAVPWSFLAVGLFTTLASLGSLNAGAHSVSKSSNRRTALLCTVIVLVVCAVAGIGYYFRTAVAVPSENYDRAVQLEAEGEYYEAYLLYEANGDFEDSVIRKEAIREQAFEQCYAAALEDYQAGSYETALEKFTWLGQYGDSAAYLEKMPQVLLTEDFRQADVGDEVIFGTDSDGNGISWIVLANEGDRVLVISKYVYESRCYHEYAMAEPAWEGCTLRTYMNDRLLNGWFSETEQEVILDSSLSNAPNPVYGTTGGSDTTDKLFPLSVDEIDQYMPDAALRIALDLDGTAQPWWLRSPGATGLSACVILADGAVDTEGNGILALIAATWVRPAMWIDISK